MTNVQLKALIKIDICTNNIETKMCKSKYLIGDYLPLSSKHPTQPPTSSISCNRCKNQPDGSKTDLLPHKQHEYRRHGTQMEHMPDIG